nr:hypothetical protein [Cressdnaviricota sp.]
MLFWILLCIPSTTSKTFVPNPPFPNRTMIRPYPNATASRGIRRPATPRPVLFEPQWLHRRANTI